RRFKPLNVSAIWGRFARKINECVQCEARAKNLQSDSTRDLRPAGRDTLRAHSGVVPPAFFPARPRPLFPESPRSTKGGGHGAPARESRAGPGAAPWPTYANRG